MIIISEDYTSQTVLQMTVVTEHFASSNIESSLPFFFLLPFQKADYLPGSTYNSLSVMQLLGLLPLQLPLGVSTPAGVLLQQE
jgi:hypothetical protein